MFATVRGMLAAMVAALVLVPGSAPVAGAAPCPSSRVRAPDAMARAAAPRRCPDGGRTVSAADEQAVVFPGALRPQTTTTVTITSGSESPTEFQTGLTAAVSPDGSITVTAVTPNQVTATLTTPPDEVFLTVTLTNPGGYTYEGRVDVRNRTGEFHPVTPRRVFDSRFSSATLSGPAGRLAAGQPVAAPVAGVNGLPSSGIDAVAVNVTVVDPSADGFLTAWPSQTTQPDASSINFASGRTVANLVTVGLGAEGGLALVASTATDVVLDVVGWYASPPATVPDTSEVASSYIPLPPQRRTDTRFPMSDPANLSRFPTNGPLHPDETRTLSLDSFTEEFGAVDAVALNVTISGPSEPGFVTIWPGDQPRPNTSSVNFGPGDAIPNMVIVPISAAHTLNFYNSAGNTDVIVDLVGLYETKYFGGLIFASTAPTRIIDSRLGHGLPKRPLNVNEVATLTISGVTPVPDSAVAVVMNAVIADSSTQTGFVTVYPADDVQPNVSNLNVQLGRAAANQVIAPLSRDGAGAINLFNANGPADLIADVTGYFY